MKLDSRIIDGKKPFTCFDSDEAKHFIGQNGFFSDCATCFRDLDHLHRSKLVQIYRSENYAFEEAMLFADESGSGYAYFLPEEYVMTEDEYFTFSDNAKSIALEIYHLINVRMTERNLKSYGTNEFVNEIIMKLRGMIK